LKYGAQLVKEAASKTADIAGDEQRPLLFWPPIVTEGIKMITAGSNPMVMRRGLEKASEVVVMELKKMGKAIKQTDIPMSRQFQQVILNWAILSRKP